VGENSGCWEVRDACSLGPGVEIPNVLVCAVDAIV